MCCAVRALDIRYLPRTAYADAWDLQRDLVERRKADTIPDTLLLLEHDPVITLGRNAGTTNVLADAATLDTLGVDLVQSDRGGDVTFHGPGQVVGYPVLDLRPDRMDVRRYVRNLEAVMIATLADYDVAATRFDGEPGVWLEAPWRKVGAIGARFSRWVTWHGFALNVSTDLAGFELIVPCGIDDKGVTTLERETGRRVPLADVMDRLAHHFTRTLGYA